MTRVDELLVDPDRVVVYAEGWQSWSPTRTYRGDEPPRTPGRRGSSRCGSARGTWAVPRSGRVRACSSSIPARVARCGAMAIAGDASNEVPTIRATLHGDRMDVDATG